MFCTHLIFLHTHGVSDAGDQLVFSQIDERCVRGVCAKSTGYGRTTINSHSQRYRILEVINCPQQVFLCTAKKTRRKITREFRITWGRGRGGTQTLAKNPLSGVLVAKIQKIGGNHELFLNICLKNPKTYHFHQYSPSL